jgi:hypothetical protein
MISSNFATIWLFWSEVHPIVRVLYINASYVLESFLFAKITRQIFGPFRHAFCPGSVTTGDFFKFAIKKQIKVFASAAYHLVIDLNHLVFFMKLTVLLAPVAGVFHAQLRVFPED